ncbi:MAG: hypothetical protein GQF41_2708 [Candidatus Rifleibacterium amylolyticum]|nr:MAG: hypothetical protein GQF41_2708 [Candidatus Rifleibacterium amylolyticum]NLF95761.1 hypothetical protein [Candidatus Riflebacteria bacterium]
MSNIRRNAGITLTEIMLSFLILVVAAFSAAGVISYGHRGTVADFRQVESIQILVDRMNKLMNMPYRSLDSFLTAAGGNEYTFNNPIEGVILGDEVQIEKHTYRIHATLKRQRIVFDSLMELSFPNLDYNPASPSTWIFRDRPAESFPGGSNPFKIIKITVTAKPVGGMTDEREFTLVSFVADMES